MIDVWPAVAAERVALADLLDDVPDDTWDKPSLCGGWRVREVLAHLVALAEAQSRVRFLLKHSRFDVRPNQAVDKFARRIAASAEPKELTQRLRDARDGHFFVPGMQPVVALGEVLVHRADIAQAAGLARHPADETLRAVLEAELKLWFAFGVSPSMRKHHFVPTDATWTVGPPTGRRIEATGEELLLIACGRNRVA